MQFTTRSGCDRIYALQKCGNQAADFHVYSCLVRKYNPVSVAVESSEWNKAAFNRGGHHGEPTHRDKKPLKTQKNPQKTQKRFLTVF